jgi:5-methylthioadenosine/S-adenosylhomocysteine deaminase
VDGYLDTLYSAFELIGSGVTAVQHLDTMRAAPVSAWPDRGHAVIKAYLDIGMRVSYALCIRDQNRVVYAPDEQFIATLPPALARETADWLNKTHFRLEDYETDFLEPMIGAYSGGRENLARIWLAPINLERCSDEFAPADQAMGRPPQDRDPPPFFRNALPEALCRAPLRQDRAPPFA